MDWMKTIASVAPTVADALAGPLAGEAVTAIGALLGLNDAKPADIKKVIESGQLTSDQLFQLKQLEVKYQADEQERGFRYAELAYQDRDSARKANVAGSVQAPLLVFSAWVVLTVLISELLVLWIGLPHGISELVVGRILGLMDGMAMQMLNYWYGTSSGSAQKTELLARVKQ